MLSYQFLGILSGIIGSISGIIYIVQVLRGKQKPERASWFIWTITGFIVFFSYMYSGATDTIWGPLSMAVVPCIVFLLSLKYGTGGWNKFDQYVLIGAGLALLIWAFSGNPLLALIAISLVDIAGYFPTIKKVLRDPLSEVKTAWVIGTVSFTINLFAIQVWTLNIYITPLYLFVFGLFVTCLLFRKVNNEAVS